MYNPIDLSGSNTKPYGLNCFYLSFLGLYLVMFKSNILLLQLIRAVRCVARGAVDSQAVHLSSGPCTEGSRRGTGKGTAPGFVLTQGEGQAKTEKVSDRCIFIRYWNQLD